MEKITKYYTKIQKKQNLGININKIKRKKNNEQISGKFKSMPISISRESNRQQNTN